MTLHYGATWWQSHACAAKVRPPNSSPPSSAAALCPPPPLCPLPVARRGGRLALARAFERLRPATPPTAPTLPVCAGRGGRADPPPGLSENSLLVPHWLTSRLAQAAVDALTRNLGLEWGHFGIRTVGVAPGPIEGTAGALGLAGAGWLAVYCVPAARSTCPGRQPWHRCRVRQPQSTPLLGALHGSPCQAHGHPPNRAGMTGLAPGSDAAAAAAAQQLAHSPQLGTPYLPSQAEQA